MLCSGGREARRGDVRVVDPGARSLFPALSPRGSLLSFWGVSELSPPLAPRCVAPCRRGWSRPPGLDHLGSQSLELSLSFRPSPLQANVL